VVQSGCCQAVDGHKGRAQFEVAAADQIFNGREFFREIGEVHAGDRIGNSVFGIQRTEIIQGAEIIENEELPVMEVERAVTAVSKPFDAF